MLCSLLKIVKIFFVGNAIFSSRGIVHVDQNDSTVAITYHLKHTELHIYNTVTHVQDSHYRHCFTKQPYTVMDHYRPVVNPIEISSSLRPTRLDYTTVSIGKNFGNPHKTMTTASPAPTPSPVSIGKNFGNPHKTMTTAPTTLTPTSAPTPAPVFSKKKDNLADSPSSNQTSSSPSPTNQTSSSPSPTNQPSILNETERRPTHSSIYQSKHRAIRKPIASHTVVIFKRT